MATDYARPPMTDTAVEPRAVAAEGALITAVAAGDGAAFTEMYAEYNERLVGVLARRTGDRAIAEDLAHEALLTAAGKAHLYETGRPLWPWLKRIAVNLSIDYYRRHPSRERPLLGDELLPSRAHDVAELHGDREILLDALRLVPDRQRLALVLHYLEGWEPTAVADRLGIGRHAADQLLYRARASLRREYERLDTTRGVRLLVPLWAAIAARAQRLRHRAGAIWDGLVVHFQGATALADAATVTFTAIAVAVSVGAPSAAFAHGAARAAPAPVVAAADAAHGSQQSDRPRAPRRDAVSASAARRHADAAAAEARTGRGSTTVAGVPAGARHDAYQVDARAGVRRDQAVHAESSGQSSAGEDRVHYRNDDGVHCEGTAGSAACAVADVVADHLPDVP